MAGFLKTSGPGHSISDNSEEAVLNRQVEGVVVGGGGSQDI